MIDRQTATQFPIPSPSPSSRRRPYDLLPPPRSSSPQHRTASFFQDSVIYTVDVESEETSPLLWTRVSIPEESNLCMLGQVCKMVGKFVALFLFLLVSFGLPVSMIIVAAVYPADCRAGPHLTVYLCALGVVLLMRMWWWVWWPCGRIAACFTCCVRHSVLTTSERLDRLQTFGGWLLDGAWIVLLALVTRQVYLLFGHGAQCHNPAASSFCPCWLYLYSVCTASVYWVIIAAFLVIHLIIVTCPTPACQEAALTW